MARKKRARAPKQLEGDTTDPRGMVALGRAHLSSLRQRNYSEQTAVNRTVALRRFIAWCEARAVLRPEEVTRAVLEAYSRHLFHYRKANGKPLGARSRYVELMGVKEWFRWLTRARHLALNPASELELPKLARALPREVLTVTEAERVLGSVRVEEPIGLRDRALMEVLYATGVRRMEVTKLRVDDVDRERGVVWVREGKGGKDRVVPTGERALAWVGKYLAEARPQLAISGGEGRLFVSATGEGLTPSGVTHLVRRRVLESGIGKKGGCHLFRHTCATLMLEGGADIRYIQEMLGHAKLETTQIYTRVSIGKLKAVHAATHPGARLESMAEPDANADADVSEPDERAR
jgi:integrase/recombinase XerD